MRHDDFAHADAAYVLGALTPMERRAFEEHLRDCAPCSRSVRDLAGIPPLLSQLDRAMFEPSEDALPLPDTLLPGLLRQVHEARRRRLTWSLAGTAAALLLGAVGVGIWTAGDGTAPGEAGSVQVPSADAPLQMRQVGQRELAASLALEQVPWGTRLELVCTYDGGHDPYAGTETPSYSLVVHTRDGRSEQVATWQAVPGRSVEVPAATAAGRDEISSVDVRTLDGRLVLKADVT